MDLGKIILVLLMYYYSIYEYFESTFSFCNIMCF